MRIERSIKWLLYCLFIPGLSLFAFSTFAQQACDSTFVPSAPNSRYTIHGDGTVTDNQTGLMWKQCSEGLSGSSCGGTASKMTWAAALQLAGTTNSGGGFAGYTDWRLPNIKELASLIEVQCRNPAINETAFPGTQFGNANENYWTSTPAALAFFELFNSEAWTVRFDFGQTRIFDRISVYNVRFVRGG